MKGKVLGSLFVSKIGIAEKPTHTKTQPLGGLILQRSAPRRMNSLSGVAVGRILGASRSLKWIAECEDSYKTNASGLGATVASSSSTAVFIFPRTKRMNEIPSAPRGWASLGSNPIASAAGLWPRITGPCLTHPAPSSLSTKLST